MLKQIVKIASLLMVGLFLAMQANAQTATRAVISAPELGQFPQVTTRLDVRDAQEAFVPGLQAGDVTVIEDGVELAASELVELKPGLQFVLAINTATAFAIRDSQGATRYDYLSQFLQGWANSLEGEELNDFSLVTPVGTAISHTADAEEWTAALAGYTPDFENASPTLDVLSLGIDLAADPSPEFGMARGVLFITSTLDANFNEAVASLGQRAREVNVRVFVWMVDSQALFTSDAATVLQSLATQTGGQFFAFSGIEPIPDIGAQLEAARGAYRLVYRSQITTGGAHEVSVRVQKDDWVVTSEPHAFDLDLQPPSVAFVSPPMQILRTVPEGSFDLADLQPTLQGIEVLIEFPDGLPRQLRRSMLYVNGEMVAENTASPFEIFAWDISQYTASQDLILRVEVQDELGLSAATIDTPVMLTVEPPPGGLRAVLARINPMVVVSVVIVAGAVLLLVLVTAGRIHPRQIGARRKRRKHLEDPLTQPVRELEPTKTRMRRLAQLTERIPTPRLPLRFRPGQAGAVRSGLGQAIAFLTPLNEDGKGERAEKLAVITPEMTFGSDAERATFVLDDPAVEGLHARLWRTEAAEFLLADENTVAGTWVNYAPVSEEGGRVEHGDLIHIGRTGFRFNLREPESVRKPVVIREGEGK